MAMAERWVRVEQGPCIAFIYWVMEPDFLVIVDSFNPKRPTVTVTNAIEQVLAMIDREIEMPQRVIYRDSDGLWDEVLLDGARKFAGFAPIARVPFLIQQMMKACDGQEAA